MPSKRERERERDRLGLTDDVQDQDVREVLADRRRDLDQSFPVDPEYRIQIYLHIHLQESALHTLSPYVYGTARRRTNFIANLRPCAHLPAASSIQAISQRSKRDVPSVCSLAVGSFEEVERFQEGSVEGYQSEEDGGGEIEDVARKMSDKVALIAHSFEVSKSLRIASRRVDMNLIDCTAWEEMVVVSRIGVGVYLDCGPERLMVSTSVVFPSRVVFSVFLNDEQLVSLRVSSSISSSRCCSVVRFVCFHSTVFESLASRGSTVEGSERSTLLV